VDNTEKFLFDAAIRLLKRIVNKEMETGEFDMEAIYEAKQIITAADLLIK
jgi:ribosomal protein S21